MAFSIEAIETPAIPHERVSGPQEFDLPSKEFIGYDLKGTTSVTGSPLRTAEANPKQENTSEATSGAGAPKTEESVSLSPKISAIARAEQARLKREQALVQREKALEAKLADAEKYSQLKAKIAAKDYSAADELGMTYDQYTEYLVKKQAETNPEEQRYRTLEERQKALEKAQEEKDTREYEQNQKLWKAAIVTEFGDGDNYPNLAYMKSKGMKVEDDILDHINKSFDEDGVELTEKSALEEFEKEAIRRAELLSEAPVLKQKFQEPPRALGAPKTSQKTITQNMTVTSEKRSLSKPFHMMSEMEQWEEARRRVEAARLQGR